MSKVLLIISLFFLFGCSSSSLKNDSKLKQTLNLYFKNEESLKVKVFNYNDIKHINYPLIEVKTNGILVQALMLPLSTRHGIRNYSSGSGQGITLDNNVVTKTQGMDAHLVSLEFTEKPDFLRNHFNVDHSQKYQKRYTFVTPMFDTKIYLFECSFSKINSENLIIFNEEIPTTIFEEKCFSNITSFKNSYWIDNNSIIRKSRQWISPDNIFADILFLKIK